MASKQVTGIYNCCRQKVNINVKLKHVQINQEDFWVKHGVLTTPVFLHALLKTLKMIVSEFERVQTPKDKLGEQKKK